MQSEVEKLQKDNKSIQRSLEDKTRDYNKVCNDKYG